MKDDRRRLIKSMAIGGGAVAVTRMPTEWSRPVVETVVLPAHAQTTTPRTTTMFGSNDIVLGMNDGEESRFRHFAFAPLLDRWVEQAHALNPIPIENIVFAFVKRDTSAGAGWWRVQVLDRVVVTEAITDTTRPPAIGMPFVTTAHAGPTVESCVSERLYESLIEVADNGASAWSTNVGSTDGCGNGFHALGPTVDIRLKDFDDRNNPSGGRVEVGESESPIVTINVNPGGSPLAVDCEPNACEGN